MTSDSSTDRAATIHSRSVSKFISDLDNTHPLRISWSVGGRWICCCCRESRASSHMAKTASLASRPCYRDSSDSSSVNR